MNATSSAQPCSRLDIVQAMDYMTRSNPIKSAKTATGGEIKSDGRVLVIVLKPATASASK